MTRMGEKRNTYKVFIGKSEGREHLENEVFDGRIILKLSRSRNEGRGMDSSGSRKRQRSLVRNTFRFHTAR